MCLTNKAYVFLKGSSSSKDIQGKKKEELCSVRKIIPTLADVFVLVSAVPLMSMIPVLGALQHWKN